MLERVDVDLILRVLDRRGDGLRADLQPIAAARAAARRRPSTRSSLRTGRRLRADRAAAAITSPREQSTSSASVTVTDWPATASLEVAVGGDDPLDPRDPARRQHPHLGARRRSLPTRSARQSRGNRWLGRLTHCTGIRNGLSRFGGRVERHRVEMLEQARPVVPRHRLAPAGRHCRRSAPTPGSRATRSIPISSANCAIIGAIASNAPWS